MTEQPNIKKAILENVLIDNPVGGDEFLIGNMRELAEERGWELDRVIKHFNELTCLTCGSSPVHPFPWDEDACWEKLESYK